ncbi:MAG: YdcF family protein [Meiothermus sp.]|uniref:YdcF family protein n=1 Tax=Meiothermus sp. TaxID=1955249 RepID=UPI00298F0F87|nr:YdcF family protein [Meiothermus sp.]MDW8482482.1 YdcF family protein [Meiothermus sp.]
MMAGVSGRWLRVLVASGLSLLLLPLGLALNPDMGSSSAGLLWLLGTSLGLFPLTFRFLLAAGGLLALFTGVVLFTPLTAFLVRGLVVRDAPQKADLIVVLGGGMHCGAGELEASSLARLEKGLELWRAGYAPRLTLSDTVGEIFGSAGCPSLGRVALERVRALYGEAGPEVVLLPKMRTTRTEALAVAKLVRDRGYRRVLLVTTPTHSRRAVAAFRKLGLEVWSVPSSEPRFDMALPTPADRLQALTPIVREYLGLLKYSLQGWL